MTRQNPSRESKSQCLQKLSKLSELKPKAGSVSISKKKPSIMDWGTLRKLFQEQLARGTVTKGPRESSWLQDSSLTFSELNWRVEISILVTVTRGPICGIATSEERQKVQDKREADMRREARNLEKKALKMRREAEKYVEIGDEEGFEEGGWKEYQQCISLNICCHSFCCHIYFWFCEIRNFVSQIRYLGLCQHRMTIFWTLMLQQCSGTARIV